MTPTEKALFQEMSNNTYRQFIRDVIAQRPQLSSDTKNSGQKVRYLRENRLLR